MSDDFDAAEKRLEEMDRANLFLNHGRAKHADSCWRCDEPWPCLTMRVIIDADHEWAHWHDKWIAALDLMGSQSERAEKAEAELAAEREQRERLEKALRDQAHACGSWEEEQDRIEAAREVLRPAAPSAQHVEMDEGESCSCGWTSHTKAWRAHAAHMRRRGETTSENSLPLGHEFEPCPSLMPDGFPARFCVLKSPKQTECHFWHLHPAHYCGQPESAHRRKP